MGVPVSAFCQHQDDLVLVLVDISGRLLVLQVPGERGLREADLFLFFAKETLVKLFDVQREPLRLCRLLLEGVDLLLLVILRRGVQIAVSLGWLLAEKGCLTSARWLLLIALPFVLACSWLAEKGLLLA